MKKYMMLLVLVITLVCVTGCGGEKLNCTMENNGVVSEATAKVSGGKVTSTTIKMSKEATSEEEAQQIKTAFESLLESEKEDYIKADVDVKGKTVTMTATLQISKMTDEQIKSNLKDTELTIDGMKKYYTEKGYTCK